MTSETKQENILRGIIFALIGCLLGGVVWVIVSYFGYFAFIAGLAIVFLGIKGYELGAGLMSKKGLLFVGLLSILTALFATYISWAFFLTNDYNTFFNLSGPSSVSVIEMLPITHQVIFLDADLRSAFILEIIYALVFILLPTVMMIVQYNRELKATETVKIKNENIDENQY